MENWQKMKTEYLTTATSYRRLAEKYGIHRNRIARIAAKEGWPALRQQYLETAPEAAPSAQEKQNPDRAARLSDAADLLVGRISRLVLDAEPEQLEPKSIRALAAALKDLKQVQAQPQEDTSDIIEVVFAAGPEEWNG